MPSRLQGPFELADDAIVSAVNPRSPGAFALGFNAGEAFEPRFVGRSDVDVARALQQHIGRYPHFKVACLDSPKEAFEKECVLYHNLGASHLDSRLHPSRPSGSGWQCPRCRVFDY